MVLLFPEILDDQTTAHGLRWETGGFDGGAARQCA
eukprot:CAMPEP_0118963872 /NCGR_PEP_ID=MMETSP1173-20130426/1699_1 /TAXON_ID=1034831 /ORGANISM="Rhizochromulina marina cf, Strain CCMP1243" /LENGTH=34 /DNA_ID= /DNA_START= /DNA_END= /DNA_ORIENTATION=